MYLPLVGWLLDIMLRRVLAKRLSAFQVHMREESRNLKQLLETRPVAWRGDAEARNSHKP